MIAKEIGIPKKVVSIAAQALILCGCAASDPSIVTGPDAEISFDGLYRVSGSRADEAWARADIDLSSYSKIRFEAVGIEYRPGARPGRTLRARSESGPFEVTEEQKSSLREIVSEAFREELGRSKRFALVDESGPDVLLIRASLLDVVSYVPPEPIGRREVYIRSVGEATLVLEIRDSESGAILARAVDRDAAENVGGTLQQSNRITNTAEVRRVANHWASLLRQRLDAFGGE